MIRRTRLLIVLAFVGAVCVCIGVPAGSGSAAPRSSPSSAATSRIAGSPNLPAPTSSSNRRAATRDAARLRGLVTLPPGAIRVSTQPPGDDKLLIEPPQEPTGQVVDRFGWWQVPATFDSVVAFLQTHRPRGSEPQGSGRAGGPAIPENEMFSFAFPPSSGVSIRTVTFYAVALRGGGTGIRVDAQESWILARPASEKVPAGVHEVEITSVRPSGTPILSRSVTDRAKVRRIISLLDQMQIVQPGTYSCPLLPEGQPVVTFDFRAAAGQPVLAQASVTDYGFESGPCNAVSFSIRGHRQKPLLGGSFLSQIQRLLGIRFR